MSDVAPVFSGSVPAIYQSHLVPLIFDVYARDLADRVAAGAPRKVLELAAGTGVVTRALAPLLPDDARYVVTDLNGPMLEAAQALQPPDARLEWQTADAMALPFPDASFDALLCQFGVMFFPDKPAAFTEARRVLKPGGALCFNAWDRIEANAFPDAVMRALSDLLGSEAPDFMSRIPHGYDDPERIAADLRAGGFERIGIETVTETSVGESAQSVAVAFCQGTPMRAEIEARDGADLDDVTAAVADALAKTFGPGRISGQIRAHVVTVRG